MRDWRHAFSINNTLWFFRFQECRTRTGRRERDAASGVQRRKLTESMVQNMLTTGWKSLCRDSDGQPFPRYDSMSTGAGDSSLFCEVHPVRLAPVLVRRRRCRPTLSIHRQHSHPQMQSFWIRSGRRSVWEGNQSLAATRLLWSNRVRA